ncbi:PDZ domain-containing protein [Chengkuizengella axinellae]|uniref:PDZ domain-containing protein n=1 Tax=Chengkuizengella axinellae TaxID=3064388 RepID=A0ABT9J2V0_9BACL|nr:PDZ domain-containing protein [Chengkuizengella sp. 2205SS18-9]MDP5275918.1 PDZ domain-containing protein [Chengkuizengella sp. 2205SS18-9]
MEFIIQLSLELVQALKVLFLQPFYYLGILFVIFQYRRQIYLERKLFHTKLHSLLNETWKTLGWGLLGGFVCSVFMIFLGVSISFEVLIILWIISLILILFRVRFLCFSYSVGILGILHVLIVSFPFLGPLENTWIIQVIKDVNVPSLLSLVAIVHMLEAFLYYINGVKSSTPLFIKGKRGKIVGGYHFQGFWPVPLFLLIPTTSSSVILPWNPILSSDMLAGGWMMIAFPIVIGFSEMTRVKLPVEKVKWSAKWLLIYSIVLLGLAIAANYLPILTFSAVLFCIIFHEGIVYYSKKQEINQTPIYVHDESGLYILGILPNSPAEKMGVETGEKIHKVNGLEVHTKEELHQAIRMNPAYCKLEIINLDGQSKFVKCPLFSGEHHQLGLIIAPDEKAMYYMELHEKPIWSYVRMKLSGIFKVEQHSKNNVDV